MSLPESRRRLLFLHSSDELYGADRVLLDQVVALPPTVDVEVWLPNDLAHGEFPLCERLEQLGVMVRHVPLPIMRRAYQTPIGLTRLAARTAALARRLHAHRPDIVYCTTSATFLAAPAARLARVPHVVGHVHEIWGDTDRKLLGPLAHRCDHLLAISSSVFDSLPRDLRGRTTVVPNGTADREAATPLREHDGPLTFLIASRWNAWKGHSTLLQAWQHVDNARLIVLGGAPPSGAATDVPDLAARVDHPETIEIVGEVDDIAPYLDRADVMVVPSDHPEPFGLVAIEAFAQARPVIGSAAGGLRDIVTPDQDGWLFPVGDHRALAELITGLDRPTVEVAGKAARTTFEERFTSEVYAETWWRVLAGACEIGVRPALLRA